MMEGKWEILKERYKFFYFEFFVRAGAVDLGDAGVVMILRPYSEADDEGMREGRALSIDLGDGSAVMILRPYSQTDDEGMREGSELLFLVLEVLCRFSCPTPQTDAGGMTEGRTRAFVLGVGAPVWFSCLTLQTDDGGMTKGIINDFYTFCYLEYFVRAGLVHGDGGAVLGHRPYSQMDDGGIRERRSCRSCRWWCCDDSPTLPHKRIMEE
ncbi:hypothetical protein TNCV_337251 [Trichonephila clavipes]|nr:hypothetical protein TNCV_337251 [Trichonephila clavipes]